MDHSSETKVDLAATDGPGHILRSISDMAWYNVPFRTYAGIVRLEQSNLNAFVGKVALGLSKVKGSMARRSVP